MSSSNLKDDPEVLLTQLLRNWAGDRERLQALRAELKEEQAQVCFVSVSERMSI